MTTYLFTPIDRQTGKRLALQLSPEDFEKSARRGERWQATVTNQQDGRRYRMTGASCGCPRCFCDALAQEITKKGAH